MSIVQPEIKPSDATDFVPIPPGEIKTEPDYTPFVPIPIPAGEIKTEPDYTPFVDSDGNVFIKDEVTSDVEADSDPETIFYLPNKNLRNQIYRKRAKKRALKILAKKRDKKLQNIKKHMFYNRLTFQ